MSFVRRVPFAWAVFVQMALTAIAEGQSPTFSITITEPSELVDEIGTTRRLTRADIEARSARTLEEALRLLPGVFVRTGGDGTPRIDVRGFRSRHVLLLVNGVPFNSTADGQFDPARISTAAIREIKVNYGNSSVLYGDNAMAGVIEITTVDAEPDASASLNVGSPTQNGASGRFARTIGKWSLATVGTGFATKGFRLPGSFAPTPLEDGGRRQNSDRDRGDWRGSVGYRATPSLSIASEWLYGAGSYGVPAGTIADSSDVFAQVPRFERVENFRTLSGQVSVVAEPSSRFNLRLWAFRNTQREDRSRYDDATYSSMDDPLVAGTFQSRERTTTTGASALGRLDLRRFGWVRVAVNQRREGFDSNGVVRDVAVGGTGTTGGGGGGGGGGRGGGAQPTTYAVRNVAVDRHIDVYSTGAEWQVRPTRRLGSVLGAALNVRRRPDASGDVNHTWIAGVSYQASSAVTLRTSAARKIRVPSIDQLFNASSGNPFLRSERSLNVDAGVDYRLGARSSLGGSVFVADARDFIERTTGLPFENQDRYRFRGVEVTARTARLPSVDLEAGYSFLDAFSIEAAGTRRLQTRPRHRASLQWMWTPAASASIRGAVSRTGSQLFDARGGNPLQLGVHGYTVVDAGLTQRFGRRLELAFDVTNVFDTLYDQAYGLPREGRAALATLRVRAN